MLLTTNTYPVAPRVCIVHVCCVLVKVDNSFNLGTL
jgi:hypothetical protein